MFSAWKCERVKRCHWQFLLGKMWSYFRPKLIFINHKASGLPRVVFISSAGIIRSHGLGILLTQLQTKSLFHEKGSLAEWAAPSGVNENYSGATWNQYLELIVPLEPQRTSRCESRCDRGTCCGPRWGPRETAGAWEKRYSINKASPDMVISSCPRPCKHYCTRCHRA